MGLEEHSQPTGAYYTPALVARYADAPSAEAAIESLRGAGFTTRDIDVAQGDGDVTMIVSEPTPGMLEQAMLILRQSGAQDVRPYGSGGDPI